ncbi:response regulator transcription factor [Paenibacillus cremeus]|uniref:Response regulator transcription factor n=1 Tax=Paenibacillus cremeus TaxID=2163881 RepID=A0A559K850_9BACL|nr:response regulator transcription factor [Paenibacillus cremeus]TVY08302.1 response regulator transcription factor [Paenibacillus cremeus]
MNNLIHILIVDDDPDIAQLIAHSLKSEGYQITVCHSGKEALVLMRNHAEYTLLILDIVMPEIDGLEVCRQIRAQFEGPIVLLSGKDRELDKVIGLEIGADDYVTKPFMIGELVSRIKAHLRREQRSAQRRSSASGILSFQHLLINKNTFEVYKNAERVLLTTKEFQILVYLAESRGRVLSREQIYDAIWGNWEFGDLNTVTVHIKNLRDKLDPGNKYIKTVWGAGYKFTGDSPTS